MVIFSHATLMLVALEVQALHLMQTEKKRMSLYWTVQVEQGLKRPVRICLAEEKFPLIFPKTTVDSFKILKLI